MLAALADYCNPSAERIGQSLSAGPLLSPPRRETGEEVKPRRERRRGVVGGPVARGVDSRVKHENDGGLRYYATSTDLFRLRYFGLERSQSM